MPERPQALVLEDNPREAQEVSALTTACGLATLTTRSPQQAVRLLRVHAPALAVIDWNMEQSPDPDRTSEVVLRELARLHPDAYTIVYAANVGGDLSLQERIAAAHPAAVTHDKRLGLDTLMTRIRKLLQRRVGDLVIDRGCVMHIPTGERHKHRMAVKLLLAHPRDVYAERRSAQYQALYRFQRWLEEQGSSVSVLAVRGGFHRLVIRDEAQEDAGATDRS